MRRVVRFLNMVAQWGLFFQSLNDFSQDPKMKATPRLVRKFDENTAL
jgi:hypothetical protein